MSGELLAKQGHDVVLHFAINTLAPYVLTALIPASRLVYLSSGMHRGGRTRLDDPQWTSRRWSSSSCAKLSGLAFSESRS